MTHPRADALDALDHLACKLMAVADLMDTKEVALSEDAVFGLYLIFCGTAAKIKEAKAKLESLIPAH